MENIETSGVIREKLNTEVFPEESPQILCCVFFAKGNCSVVVQCHPVTINKSIKMFCSPTSDVGTNLGCCTTLARSWSVTQPTD